MKLLRHWGYSAGLDVIVTLNIRQKLAKINSANTSFKTLCSTKINSMKQAISKTDNAFSKEMLLHTTNMINIKFIGHDLVLL